MVATDVVRRTTEARTQRVYELVGEVGRGVVRIPGFQRLFKWNGQQILELFDSLYRGYPIGTIFFWRRAAEADTVTLGPLSITAPDMADALWVVDGQQRLTSLAGVLLSRGDSDDDLHRRFRLYFDLESQEFVRPRLGRRSPPHWLPMSVLLDTGALLRWQNDNVRDSPELITRADEVVRQIRDYVIPTYVIEADDDQVVREIFDRLNSAGKPLTNTEVFRALHEGAGLAEPAELSTLIENVGQSSFGPVPEQIVLYSVLAVRGGDVTRHFRGEFSPGEDPGESYRRTEDALIRAIDYLRREAKIPHSRLLPTTFVVPVLARFFAQHEDPDDWTLTLLRRWVWRMSLARGFYGGPAAALRRAVLAVRGEGQYDALALLSQLSPSESDDVTDLSRPRLNRSRTRAQVCFLALRQPRSMASGELIDIPALLAEYGTNAVQRIASDDLSGWLLHPPLGRSLVDHVCDADEGTLRSHLIDEAAVAALRRGDQEGFLERRADGLARWLIDQEERLTERNAVDRPSVPSLVLPDEEAV